MSNPAQNSPNGSAPQVEENFRAFQAKLPELIVTHAGKLAVMRNGEIVDFFDSYADAVKFGLAKFGDFGNFSVQQVSNDIKSMGYYSYACHL